MDKTVIIEGDALDVVRRIKGIDSRYFVLYNLTRRRYELHSRKCPADTFQAVLPFKKLDKRAVDYVLKTRIEKIREIAAEIELNNRMLELKKLKQSKDHTMELIDSFCSRVLP